MNEYYVLDIANSLNELEQDYNDWQSLQYDLRRKSDTFCIQKYGMTNTQFYNMQRGNFLYYSGYKLQHEIANIKALDDNGDPVQPSLKTLPAGCTSSGEINIRADKILASKRVEATEDDWIVISDWLNEETPDYTLDDLVAKYNKYLNVTQGHKDESNAYSFAIWGKSVPEMYLYMKGKLQKNNDINNDPVSVEESVSIPQFTPDINDQALLNFKNTIITESGDDLQLMVRKLDCLCPHKSSMYENYVLESYGDKIKIGNKSYRADIPGVVPFLQYDEYVNNAKGLDSRKIVGGMFPYVLSYDEKPRQRYHELEEAWKNKDTEKMLEMGWNPVVKPSIESMKEARERQIEYLDKMYPISIYDISKYNTNYSHDVLFEAEMDQEKNYPSSKQLKPVFLVLSCKKDETIFSKMSNKLFYDTEYNHVGISFDSSLANIYVYSSVSKTAINRLDVESIDSYKYNSGTIRIIAFFVRKEIYTKLKDSMKNYMTLQDNSPYTFDNVFSLVSDVPKLKGKSLSILCASYLDSMFKIANVHDKLAGAKNPNANIHFYILYTGNPKGYKYKEVDKRVKVLQKNLDFKKLSFFEPDLVLDQIQYKLLENFNMKTSNDKVNAVLKQIQEMLTPNDAYLEAATTDVETEIQKIIDSSNLLAIYGSTEVEAMKREVSNIYNAYNNIYYFIDKDHIAKEDPRMNKIEQVLTKAETDIDTYCKVIYQIDKDFDLQDYSLTVCNIPKKEINRSKFKYSTENFID